MAPAALLTVLHSLGFAFLLAAAGTVVAAVWTYVLGLAGAPGGAITVAGVRRRSSSVALAGALVSFIAQAYLALAFTACIVLSVAHWARGHAGLPVWPVLLGGWYLGTAPALLLTRDRAKATAHHVRSRLAGATVYLAALAYWLFLWRPALLSAWPWVPSIPL